VADLDFLTLYDEHTKEVIAADPLTLPTALKGWIGLLHDHAESSSLFDAISERHEFRTWRHVLEAAARGAGSDYEILWPAGREAILAARLGVLFESARGKLNEGAYMIGVLPGRLRTNEEGANAFIEEIFVPAAGELRGRLNVRARRRSDLLETRPAPRVWPMVTGTVTIEPLSAHLVDIRNRLEVIEELLRGHNGAEAIIGDNRVLKEISAGRTLLEAHFLRLGLFRTLLEPALETIAKHLGDALVAKLAGELLNIIGEWLAAL